MKKVIVIAMAIVALICLSSTVCAGLFDFGNSVETGDIGCQIKSSKLDIDITEGKDLGSGVFKQDIYFNGSMELELKNATDEQLNYLKENINDLNTTTEINASGLRFSLNLVDGANYTINGNVLTIDFDSTDNCISFEKPDEMKYTSNVTNVNVTIPTDNGEICISGTIFV